MSKKILKVKYFPSTEVAIFFSLALGLTTALVLSQISWWVFIIIILPSYFFTLGTANIIRLDANILKVISFNPFIASHSIRTKSIVRIYSVQTFEHQSHNDLGVYFQFTKRYDLEYIDTKGRKNKTTFWISNKTKERLILNNLKPVTS